MLKKNEIKKIINKMTLKEKVGQLNQPHYGWQLWQRNTNGEMELTNEFKKFINEFGGIGSIYGLLRTDPWTKVNSENGFKDGEQIKIINLVQEYLISNTRLQIPTLIAEECPHGHQSLYSESYPTNISIGSSFDISTYSKAIAEQRKTLESKGVNLGLFSGLDIPIDKRWGRTEECFSEDPFIAYKMNEKLVSEIQKTNKVGVTIKHFIGYGASVDGKNGLNANIGKHELEEIHMKSFYGALKSKVASVMVAYNEIDGIPCIVNKDILTNILRKKIKYDGMIMADGFAIDGLKTKWINDDYKVASEALNSGINISLWDKTFLKLDQCLQKGLIKEKTINDAVEKVLSLKNKLGLLDSYKLEQKNIYKEDKEKNKDMAISGSVLIKNDNFLPLSNNNPINKVLVIGNNIDDIYYQLGDYSSFQNDEYTTYKDGLERLFDKLNWKADYSNYQDITKNNTKNYDLVIFFAGGNSKRNFNSKFDINGAIITSSKQKEMTSGEGVDIHNLDLPKDQTECFEIIDNKNILTILNMGKPMVLTPIIEKSKAILNMWYPGGRGGDALYEILLGIKEPSGRLSHSFPRYSGLNSLRYNDKNISQYKYFDLYEDEALFNFGFGLGYGKESKIENIKHEIKNNKVSVSFRVLNENDSDRYETILLFKKTRNSYTTPRKEELIGFTKIFLNPNEDKEVIIKGLFREKYLFNDNQKSKFETNEFYLKTGQNKYKIK